MELLTLDVEGINPAVYNPRKDLKPSDPEYEKLKKSILEFDMVEPLVWNKRTGNLVGGHQRLKVLRELGIKKVEVSVVDLSEVKEKALNLALNKIQGEWDMPRLKDLLEELDTGEFDIEITGFDLSEIEDLMNQFHVPTEGLTDDDEIPEQVETICKRGDLWRLGEHRLLCGDATLKTDIDKLMEGEKADMVFTDPPYGQLQEGWDKFENQQAFNDFTHTWLVNLIHVLAKSYNAFISFNSWNNWNFEGLLLELGLPIKGHIIFHYRNLAQQKQSKNSFVKTYQPILHFGNKPMVWGKHKWSENWFDVQIHNTPQSNYKEGRFHISQKPIPLLLNLIEPSCLVGDTTLDFFGGSGSTLIACEKLGRKCHMMEIDEHYCDVIIQRWQNFTGKQAIKL